MAGTNDITLTGLLNVRLRLPVLRLTANPFSSGACVSVVYVVACLPLPSVTAAIDTPPSSLIIPAANAIQECPILSASPDVDFSTRTSDAENATDTTNAVTCDATPLVNVKKLERLAPSWIVMAVATNDVESTGSENVKMIPFAFMSRV